MEVSRCNPRKVSWRLSAQAGGAIIEIRRPSEFAEGHIPGAIKVDCRASTFRQALAELDKGKMYLVCGSLAEPTDDTLDKMRELQFPRVFGLLDGFDAWSSKGLPVVE